MILTHLIGGLGNQMFQYAAGKSLAIEHNTTLMLDTGDFERYKKHSYALDMLKISGKNATDEELKSYKTSGILKKFLINFSPNRKIYQEKHFHYDSNFYNLNDNIYLKGYWQSENYFFKIRDILIKEFKPKSHNIDKDLIRNIETGYSVSIHIRRGDYLSDKKANEVHGIVELDYYKKAIKLINSVHKDATYYIFSDDMEWVKENLIFDNKKVFICDNKDYEDMYLMSLCKSNIIANSSFSWWAAWLNENENKMVIAPKKWLLSTELDVKDLCPEDWVRL